MTADELAERMAELGRLKDEREAATKAEKEAKDAYKRFEQETIELMYAVKIPSLRHDGDLYVCKSTPYGHVEDEDAFVEWLRETDQYDEFMKPEPVKRRLNELARDLIERKVPEDEWPPGLGWYPQPYISRQKGPST